MYLTNNLNEAILSVGNGGRPTSESNLLLSAFRTASGTVAWLTDSGVTNYHFSEVRLNGNAGLAANSTGISLSIFLKYFISFRVSNLESFVLRFALLV